jgi:tetratricopeptide (TPR) repeat protein
MKGFVSVFLLLISLNTVGNGDTVVAPYFPDIAKLASSSDFEKALSTTADLLQSWQTKGQLQTVKGAEIVDYYLTVQWRSGQAITPNLLSLAENALQTVETLAKSDLPRISRAHKTLGHILQMSSQYQDSLMHFELALQINEQYHGKETKQLITLHNQIAVIAQELNNAELAIYNLKKATELALTHYGPEHRFSVGVSINLALLLNDSGRIKEAINKYHRAISLSSQALGEQHLFTLIAINNLGDTYYGAGDLENAYQFMQKAREGLLATTGKQTTNYARTIHNLGNITRDQNRFDLATHYYQECETLYQQLYPQSDHAERARLLRDLGILAREEGNLEKSLGLLNSALSIYSPMYGKGVEQELLITQIELAQTMLLNKQYQPALALADKVLTSYQKIFQTDNPVALSAAILKSKILATTSDNQFIASVDMMLKQLTKRLAFNSYEQNDSFLFERALFKDEIDQLLPYLLKEWNKNRKNNHPLNLALKLSQLTKPDVLSWVTHTAKMGKDNTIVKQNQTRLLEYRQLISQHQNLLAKHEYTVEERQSLQAIQQRLQSLAIAINPSEPILTSLPISARHINSKMGDTRFLYYHFGKTTSFRWEMGSGQAKWQHIDVSLEQLNQRLTHLRQPMFLPYASLRELQPYDLNLAKTLSGLLLGGIDSLTKLQRILIFADDTTLTIPFVALPNPSTEVPDISHFSQYRLYKNVDWLSAHTQFSYTSTFDKNSVQQSESVNLRSSIGIGDALLGSESNGAMDLELIKRGDLVASVEQLKMLPSLPETKLEIEELTRLLQVNSPQYLFGKDATEQNLRKSLLSNQFDAILISTHALVPTKINGLSEAAIVLTPGTSNLAKNDGLLFASEIRQFQTAAKLIVLSGCNTGSIGQPFSLEMATLLHAWLFSGADKIIATYWPVETNSQLQSMQNMFNNKPMFEGIEFPHPAFWAGTFVLSTR